MEISTAVHSFILEERARLNALSFPDYQENNGMGANFIIKCLGNSNDVLEMAHEVLLIINQHYDNDEWPSLDSWRNILPRDFIDKFDLELTEEEVRSYNKWWFNLPFSKKLKEAKKSRKWRLSNWLAWFEPNDRIWFWWGAVIIDKNHFVVSVKVLDDPFLSGALKWLFLASGAQNVIEEDVFLNKR